MGEGFSFASVVLSYFMVAGGMFTSMLALAYVRPSNEYVGYLFLALGAFVGGFFAARASRGSTIIEPAIGAVAVIGTIVGIVAGAGVGKVIWAINPGETAKVIALFAGLSAVGAFAGAFLSEKFFGEATLSSFPWVAYVGFSTFGAALLATLLLGIFSGSDASADTLIKSWFLGMGVGCLLSGIAAGASARTRPIGAAFLGGGLGIFGFGLLLIRSAGEGRQSDAMAGVAVIAGGGAIVTLVGAVIGWFAFGKKNAG